MNISHIEEVLPHIAGRDEFIVAERPGYKVIDYNFALVDSFDDPIRLELRGIKFAADGKILARPLHKFFNVGERVDTQPNVLDFSTPHIITEKLDGSMIHPAIVNGELVLMTRMGRTDVALKAEKLLTDNIVAGMTAILWEGYTPIFEFTAPNNRIIIRYDRPQLSLLAARRTKEGTYADVADLASMAEEIGLPLVKHYPSEWSTAAAFSDYVRAIEGIEGFVVRFASGLWVKAKGDDYVLKHKAKDSILQEKNVLAMVLGGQLDDVLPLLEAGDREAVEIYRDTVAAGVGATADAVAEIVRLGAHHDQKSFAVEHLKDTPSHIRPLAFSVRAGKAPRDVVTQMLLKNVGSQTAVDAWRSLHGATWTI
jgi:RNA ligase